MTVLEYFALGSICFSVSAVAGLVIAHLIGPTEDD